MQRIHRKRYISQKNDWREVEIMGKENVRYDEPIREMSSDKSEIELVEKKNSKAECSSSMCILVLL